MMSLKLHHQSYPLSSGPNTALQESGKQAVILFQTMNAQFQKYAYVQIAPASLSLLKQAEQESHQMLVNLILRLTSQCWQPILKSLYTSE